MINGVVVTECDNEGKLEWRGLEGVDIKAK